MMTDQPSEDEIATALRASGFVFEQEVAVVLENLGYYARTGASYTDPDENKPREIDVVAFRDISKLDAPDVPIGHAIIVECKSTPQTHVAFTQEWAIHERRRQPFELKVGILDQMLRDKDGQHIKDPTKPFQSRAVWNVAGLIDEWEQYRLNQLKKCVQLVRIERSGKKFAARNVTPEMGLPPIKAGYEIRREVFSPENKDGVIFPVCVTAGPLMSLPRENLTSLQMSSIDYVSVQLETGAAWMARTNHTYNRFDVVPFSSLTKWIHSVEQLMSRLNDRARALIAK
jgi:hypothetical protein